MRQRDLLVGIAGAIVGIALVLLGLRPHIGSYFLTDGPFSYLIAAMAGVLFALIIDHAYRQWRPF